MLYKRSESPNWYVAFETNGKSYRASTGTSDRSLAKRFEAKMRADAYLDRLGTPNRTWQDAVEAWLVDKQDKRSIDRDKTILNISKWSTIQLSKISPDDIREHLAAIRQGSSPANANRHYAAIRALFGHCRKLGWIKDAPKVDPYKTERFVGRIVTKEQFLSLCTYLPEHVRAMAGMAVNTGMRWSNVSGMRWDWIRGGFVVVPPGEAKAGRTIPVPLNPQAQAILDSQKEKHALYVFPDHRGHAPVGSVKTAWLRATRECGLDGFRFHDLRHTWASWHLMAGTAKHTIQTMAGWTSPAMLDRYGHYGLDYLREAAAKVGT